MNTHQSSRRFATASVVAAAMLTGGRGSVGDSGSIRAASDLAIDCRTDEALAALDKAEQSGGLSKYLAGLERVGILRDAGRDDEAARALAAYKAHPEVASSDDAEIERSLDKFVTDLRDERREKSGSATCP